MWYLVPALCFSIKSSFDVICPVSPSNCVCFQGAIIVYCYTCYLFPLEAFFICACIKPSCAQRPLLLPFLPPLLYVQDRFWFFVKYKSGRVSSLFGTLWFPVTPQIKSRLLIWPPGPLPSLLNLIKCCFFSKRQSQWLPQFQAFWALSCPEPSQTRGLLHTIPHQPWGVLYSSSLSLKATFFWRPSQAILSLNDLC